MATHSRVLAWRIPGTGEPGGLPSMGSHRVGHDWSNLAASVSIMHWCCNTSDQGFCCCSSVIKLCLTLCDLMDCNLPDFPVLHCLPEFAQIHVDLVMLFSQSYPLPPPSPFAFNLSKHWGLFRWVGSSHQVTKVLELQIQHQSFQWVFANPIEAVKGRPESLNSIH